jgi:hypothetical protein
MDISIKPKTQITHFQLNGKNPLASLSKIHPCLWGTDIVGMPYCPPYSLFGDGTGKLPYMMNLVSCLHRAPDHLELSVNLILWFKFQSWELKFHGRHSLGDSSAGCSKGRQNSHLHAEQWKLLILLSPQDRTKYYPITIRHCYWAPSLSLWIPLSQSMTY